jgi:hypothetical protein
VREHLRDQEPVMLAESGVERLAQLRQPKRSLVWAISARTS